jgi:aryl-alcohol dehydrogenase-like predicted oxidoreductase
MELRTLGTTGVAVSSYALGTMTFGAEADETASHAMLDRYLEAGGNFVDTADVYAEGASEEIIGRWIQKSGRRDDIVLATKARFRLGGGSNDVGLSRLHLKRACEASLKRLGRDTIDLYQAHCWDPVTPIEETLAGFDELVAEGKVRYIGLSNVTGWQLQRALLLGAQTRHARVVTLQPQYSLLAREIEWELVPLCLTDGVGMLPWSPLGGGWLTGKYSRDERPSGATRLGEDPDRGQESWDRRNTERTWTVIEVVQEIAAALGASMAQVALAWVTGRRGVTSTILGTRTVEQLDDNLGAARLELEPEQVARLDDVSDPGLPAYPYGFIEESSHDRTELRNG